MCSYTKLTKFSAPNLKNWFRFVEKAQLCLNVIIQRSTGFSPFQLLFGTRPRLAGCEAIIEILERELAVEFDRERDELRGVAAAQIQKIQEENRRTFDRKRKEAYQYKVGDIVAIRRTQQGPGLKLYFKYLGPYEVTTVKPNQRYNVHKVGKFEGPINTNSSADSMKLWVTEDEDENWEIEENADVQVGEKKGEQTNDETLGTSVDQDGRV